MCSQSNIFLILTLATVIIILLTLQWQMHKYEINTKPLEIFATRSKTDSSKLIQSSISILVWSGSWKLLGSTMLSDKCVYKNCRVIDDRNNVKNAKIVIFQIFPIDWNNMPSERNSDQIYVLHDYQSLKNENKTNLYNPQQLDYFNWTMTFRQDSDIYIPYFRIQKRASPMSNEQFNVFFSNLTKIVQTKTKMATQFVSHCETPGGREKYTKALQKYIQVDIYGKCGKKKCGKRIDGGLKYENCDSLITKDYKFYLSFENSFCRDYITEKFWRSLEKYAIPIIIRDSDYRDFAPAKSYIAADEFGSVQQLSNYMKYLDSNITAYMQYFLWHKDYHIPVDASNSAVCKLCEKYNKWVESGSIRKSYRDMKHWMVDMANCSNDGYIEALIKG